MGYAWLPIIGIALAGVISVSAAVIHTNRPEPVADNNGNNENDNGDKPVDVVPPRPGAEAPADTGTDENGNGDDIGVETAGAGAVENPEETPGTADRARKSIHDPDATVVRRATGKSGHVDL